MDMLGKPSTKSFEGIWPENQDAMNAFVMVCSQWRVLALPTGLMFLGLDYVAAKIIWEAAGVELTSDLFERLRYIETAAGEIMNGIRS